MDINTLVRSVFRLGQLHGESHRIDVERSDQAFAAVARVTDAITEHVATLTKERDEAHSSLDTLSTRFTALIQQNNALAAENERLSEKLAAMESQEPVAWRRYCGVVCGSPCFSYVDKEPNKDDGFDWKPLSYSKPADKPVADNGTGNVLWSDSHSEDEVLEEHSDNALFHVVVNLWEDIRCLKEDLADKTAVAVPEKLTYKADDYPKEERTQMHGYINGFNDCVDEMLAAAPSHSKQSSDSSRLDFLINNQAYIGWGSDGEKCAVYSDDFDEMNTRTRHNGNESFRDPREAIDNAARRAGASHES